MDTSANSEAVAGRLYRVECRVCGKWMILDCLPLAEAERLAEFMRLGAVGRSYVRLVPAAYDQHTKDQFVLLEGIKHGNRFISSYTPGEDPTKSAAGETWYRVLGYASSVEEAQRKLFGKAYPRC